MLNHSKKIRSFLMMPLSDGIGTERWNIKVYDKEPKLFGLYHKHIEVDYIVCDSRDQAMQRISKMSLDHAISEVLIFNMM